MIAYEIRGDTLLSTNTLMSIFAKRTGTNVALSDITQAASDLQMEYRNRGYPTVKVTIPPQQLTNGIVKIRVFEGRLSEILVTQNRYFSSNNVMRALPEPAHQYDPEQRLVPSGTGPGQRQPGPADLSAARAGPPRRTPPP